MVWRVLSSVIVLPGTVLVLVPGLLLWSVGALSGALLSPDLNAPAFWLGVGFGLIGIAFVFWTGSLFSVFGRGTAMPWDPPQKLVIKGPFRHVRNPMISGVVLILVAQSLVFDVWILAVWSVVFFVLNLIYIPSVEEAGLEARFGEDYREYKRNVPRWFPNPLPWYPEAPSREDLRP